LLTGAPPAPQMARAQKMGSRTELTVVPIGASNDGRIAWRLRFLGTLNSDPQTIKIDSATFGPPRNPELQIKYFAIKPVIREDLEGVLEMFPHSLDISWQLSLRTLKVKYDEVRLGPPLNLNLLTLSQPAGFELLTLD
ncbi:MAG: hypothetical protein ACRCTY_08955, partial [Candidatus Adiutrix sp.]